MRTRLQAFWNHPWTVVAWNIALVMMLYTILRLSCYYMDRSIFPNIDTQHLIEILIGGTRFDLTAILYLSSLYIIGSLLPFPATWRENKVYQKVLVWLYWVPNAIGLIINAADSVYIRFSDRRATCASFTEFSNEDNLGIILVNGIVEYWYVTLLGLAVLFAFFYGTRRTFSLPRMKPSIYYPTEVVIFVLSVYFSIIGIRGGFGAYTRPITLSNALQYTNAPRESALVLNTPFSLMKTIESSPYVEKNYFPADEVETHMSPIHPAESNKMRMDNVVVIIWESCSKEYIGFFNKDIPGYEGYTPFLDSLLGQSVTFRYSYASGRKSVDAMPSVLSSIPMLIEPYTLSPYSTNEVSSIAERLGKKGYTTAFFHGAPNGSMGFQAYARSAGFGAYYGMTEFNDETQYDGTWAILDEPFLQYYANTMSTMKEPFMTAVFTASSHHPFKVPAQYKDTFPKGNLPIHEPLGYTDHALRRFFENVSRQPWFDHTLFVIMADHTNQLSLPEYTNSRGLYEIPIAFYHPHLTPELSEQVVSQTDIMPSVMGWLGYDEPYFSFGENALTKEKEHPYAVCYNAPVYQIFSDSLLLQFDGEQVTGVFDYRSDRYVKDNIAKTIAPERIAPMADYLKAFIQQYIHRMVKNELTVREEENK